MNLSEAFLIFTIGVNVGYFGHALAVWADRNRK